MSVMEQMRQRLVSLDPVALDILDQSDQHAGHPGAREGGHFQLTIVSSRFAGLALMERHRLVYDALGPLMQREIHALRLTTRTPAE